MRVNLIFLKVDDFYLAKLDLWTRDEYKICQKANYVANLAAVVPLNIFHLKIKVNFFARPQVLLYCP